MTDYKPGIWYGWNGGECPVHPQTVVEVVKCQGRDAVADKPATADGYIWEEGHTIYPIIAFRVVKEYRQPRELWHLLDHAGEVFDTFTDKDVARYRANDCPGYTLVHYREVLPDDAAPLDRAMLQSATAMIPEDML